MDLWSGVDNTRLHSALGYFKDSPSHLINEVWAKGREKTEYWVGVLKVRGIMKHLPTVAY